ncbi:MAG: RluA family pseudouridine synthase [Kiloniellales bacterium]|nr:RluA family pseudouridine synthase [Kiloniellales bacterium]
MSAVRTLSVADDEADLRLDRWFRRHFPGLAHGRLEKLLRTGQIRVDGRRAKAGLRLAPGQAIRIPPAVEMPPASPRSVAPEVSRRDRAALEAAVLHRDDWVIVLDKPAGLAVQGGTGQSRHLDAMLEALRFEAAEPPRLVHRLDKDTSGVLLLGRSREAAGRLAEAFRSREARKLYWAAVVGVPEPPEGRIDLALAKGGGAGREKMREDAAEGRRAVTRYRVVDAAGRTAAWLALMPLTGRTHQLRAHCAALGTPILGDGKYGGRKAFAAGGDLPKRLHLHARAISLPHPSGRGRLEVAAPLPPHMAETWALLGFDETAEGGFD